MHALLLGDARLPTGAHAHSGGAEQAVDAGIVGDEPTLRDFLEGRLDTGIALEAHAAARACRLLAGLQAGTGATSRPGVAALQALQGLDADLDARMVSPAARTSSRRQGAHHLAAARRILPGTAVELLASLRPDPHLCVAVGAAGAAARLSPTDVAGIAAYQGLAGSASAALRLLGLDPVAVSRVMAVLAPACEQLAATAGAAAGVESALPARGAPALDRLLEQHQKRKDRLFAS